MREEIIAPVSAVGVGIVCDKCGTELVIRDFEKANHVPQMCPGCRQMWWSGPDQQQQLSVCYNLIVAIGQMRSNNRIRIHFVK